MKQILSYFDYKPDILLAVAVFFLPLYPAVSQVALGLHLIFWLINKEYKHFYKIKNNRFALGALAYFAVFFISGLYSENMTLWGRDIEAKIPLLVVPILLTSRATFSKKVIKPIFAAFAAGCLVFVGYLHYETYLGSGAIFRNTIGGKTLMNAIYFAMYLVFVFLLVAFYFFNEKKYAAKLFHWKSIAWVIALFFLNYVIYAIASRMAILSLFIIELGAVAVWKILLQRKIIVGGIWLGAIVVLNFLSVNFTQYAKTRMESAFKGDPREKIWEAALVQIPKSLIAGYGAGDAQATMVEGYRLIDFEYGVERKYNCHNQYFETLISVGLIGLLIFLGWMLSVFVVGWQHKHYLLCIFMALMALNVLTESMLERQQGGYFFAIFGCLLYWRMMNKKT